MELNGLHHLTDDTVGKQHDGGAVLVGKIERVVHKIDGLLYGGGSQDYHVIVAVTAALGGLEIIALRGLNGAQTGAAAHHVADNAGQLGACDVAYALLLKADARGGGAGHYPCARARGAVYHIDSGDLALCLQEAPADLGHTSSHVLGNVVLRSDGIAEEETAAGLDGGFCDSLAALHQFLCHALTLLTLFPR